MPGQIQPRTSKELKDKEEENDPPAKADSKKKAKKGIHQSLLLTPSLPTNPELDVVNEDDLTWPSLSGIISCHQGLVWQPVDQ